MSLLSGRTSEPPWKFVTSDCILNLSTNALYFKNFRSQIFNHDLVHFKNVRSQFIHAEFFLDLFLFSSKLIWVMSIDGVDM